MTQCNYIAQIVKEWDYFGDMIITIDIQCANEKGHTGDHLILVSE